MRKQYSPGSPFLPRRYLTEPGYEAMDTIGDKITARNSIAQFAFCVGGVAQFANSAS